ncbi:hypothetical protein TIFTF001_017339 [Ficus carica]|uniref:Uncharacterized protein n=1 Tax=Ficus carica TaxID=3494 RepID=A0AA88D6X2_FICCA|nr:hypothetical protein TIFTF001_017339 [Ficus carica]
MGWGTSELSKGISEYLNGFCQVLNVLGEDLRLCGLSGYSCAASMLGLPNALKTDRGKVFLALVVLVCLLLHGLGELCVIVLYLTACKREAPWSKEDTGGVYAKVTQILKSAMEADTEAGIRTGIVTGTVIGTGRQVSGAARADHSEGGSIVVGEVLSELVPWVPTAVCPRSPEEGISSPTEVVEDLPGDLKRIYN